MAPLRRALGVVAPATVLVTGLATGLGVLAGCTGGSTPEPSPPSPTSAASGSPTGSASPDPVTLRLAVHGGRDVRDAWARVVEVYEAEHSHVSVELERSRTPEVAQRAAESTGGTAPADLPDLFTTPSELAPDLSAADVVQPVDELLAARGVEFGDPYVRLALEAFSAEQHLQCMPYDVSPYVVLYNRGLLPLSRLAEDGDDPPTTETGWTWEQFARAARLMSRRGVKGVHVEPELAPVTAFVTSAGADVVDDPRDATTLTLSDGDTREALEEILGVLREQRLTPTPEQLARKDGVARFADEQVGMVVTTRAAVPKLRRSGLDFDAFPLPRLGRSRTVAQVSGLCLSATSAQVEEAADLMAFATGEVGASILARTGAVVPAHLPTLNSAAFAEPGVQPESAAVFVEAVSRAAVHPYVPGWSEVVAMVGSELDELFYEPVIDLDTLLPRIDDRSRRILQPDEPVEGDDG